MTRGRRAVVGLVAAIALVLVADVAILVDRDDPPSAAAPSPSPTQRPTESLDEQFVRVARTVEDIRGLRFPQLPEPTYLDQAALADRIGALVDDYAGEDAEIDARILRALGALPADYDLVEGVRALLSEQVAGFYDTETGEMVVGVQAAGRRLTPLEELILAHELQHALADATLGLPADPDDPLGTDATLARNALIEGDASLTMQQYVSVGLSVIDQLRLAGETLGTLDQFDALESQPWVLRRSLEFPYLEGLNFVAQLEANGGWSAVDAAYARPPVTTAQILFPDRYLAGTRALPVPDPGQVGDPWQQRARISFGAADLLALFEAPGDDRAAALDDPRGRVAAWGGGELTLWTDGERTAVAIVLVERSTTGDLCDSMAAWYLRGFPDVGPTASSDDEVLTADGAEQDAVVRCEGPTVRVGIGPDLTTARAAAG